MPGATNIADAKKVVEALKEFKQSGKLVSAICASLLCFSSVYASPLYSYREDIPVSASATLSNVRELYADGNISYSVIKADLTDPDTELKLFKSSFGSDVPDTVGNLANTQEDTIAAINADFFSNHKGGKAFSLGVEIDD